jgi:hypothetical protein
LDRVTVADHVGVLPRNALVPVAVLVTLCAGCGGNGASVSAHRPIARLQSHVGRYGLVGQPIVVRFARSGSVPPAFAVYVRFDHPPQAGPVVIDGTQASLTQRTPRSTCWWGLVSGVPRRAMKTLETKTVGDRVVISLPFTALPYQALRTTALLQRPRANEDVARPDEYWWRMLGCPRGKPIDLIHEDN